MSDDMTFNHRGLITRAEHDAAILALTTERGRLREALQWFIDHIPQYRELKQSMKDVIPEYGWECLIGATADKAEEAKAALNAQEDIYTKGHIDGDCPVCIERMKKEFPEHPAQEGPRT